MGVGEGERVTRSAVVGAASHCRCGRHHRDGRAGNERQSDSSPGNKLRHRFLPAISSYFRRTPSQVRVGTTVMPAISARVMVANAINFFIAISFMIAGLLAITPFWFLAYASALLVGEVLGIITRALQKTRRGPETRAPGWSAGQPLQCAISWRLIMSAVQPAASISLLGANMIRHLMVPILPRKEQPKQTCGAFAPDLGRGDSSHWAGNS